jgi:hypothetical protein
MHLTLDEIKKAYTVLKDLVFEAYNRKDLNLTLSRIDIAVGFVQQFNWVYTDDDFEQILKDISHEKLSTPTDYIPNSDRVVLFDDWCTSYVLALQYVEALSVNFKEVLYITGRNVSAMGYQNILDKIASYPNVNISVIPQNSNRFERSQTILNTIVDFCPSKLFLHIGYNSPVNLSLYSIPKGINRYLINLADQTFWLGTKGIDYTLEFRPFGTTVSLEKRGLKLEQLLYLPFYPVSDGNSFQDFPEQANGKVVIFSGGDFYKTLDPENTYWYLVRNVLNENQEAIFLYATKNIIGKTKEFIDSFNATNKFEERFIYIGFRPDIDEVFKHCDIFMGTCPVCGSLMSQLAAANSKPILQYYLPYTYDDETEQAICHNQNIQISFTDKRAFLDEAKRLIQDKQYREQRGQLIHQAMFTPEQFNSKLFEVTTSNFSQPFLKYINYKVVAERWWWPELMEFYNTIQYMFGLIGKKMYLKMFPYIACKYYISRMISGIKRMSINE